VFLVFVTVCCTVYLLFVCIWLCIDTVPVSSEHPIGGDQEEPVYEEEDNQFVEEGNWTFPLCMFFLILYNCMFTQCLLYLLLCIKLMGKHLFRGMTRCSTPVTLINPIQQMFWVDNFLVAKLGLVTVVFMLQSSMFMKCWLCFKTRLNYLNGTL
jgi:hypothetical protein